MNRINLNHTMPTPNGIITLLTDFGDADGFTGTMKGVILGICPTAKITDISHKISPQDIESGAFILRSSYRFFPAGTIHVAVVDPGVGSERRILIADTERYLFVAPDNTILKYIFHEERIKRVIDATNQEFFLKKISHTFHGRDIFAPIAAHLAAGVGPEKFGDEIQDYSRGEIFSPFVSPHEIRGKVIYIDGFGNLITNIGMPHLKSRQNFLISVGTHTIKKLSNSYADVSEGEPVALIGSSGFLEIGIRNGNACEKLNVQRNDEVRIKS